jgi:RNA polymerase sigma-70 factor (ECF subfamily)
MDTVDLLAFPTPGCEAEYLEDTSVRRIVVELYDREQQPLSRYLYFLGIDSETCREIVQESFLKLHQHLVARGDRNNLRAWLYKVAHNLARNTQTAASARKTEVLPDLSRAATLSATDISVEDTLMERERLLALRKGMEQLTPAQRECLVLRAQGFKYREIADLLSLSVSTVGENIQRGLKTLKDLV